MSKQVLLSYAGLTASLALSTSQTVTFVFTTFLYGRLFTREFQLRTRHHLFSNRHEHGELIPSWQRVIWSFVLRSVWGNPPLYTFHIHLLHEHVTAVGEDWGRGEKERESLRLINWSYRRTRQTGSRVRTGAGARRRELAES